MTSLQGNAGNMPNDLFQRHAEFFLSIFRQSGICIAHLDSDLRLIEINSDFLRWFGGSPSTLRGRGLMEFLHPSTRARVDEQISRVVDGYRKRFTVQGLALRADGTSMPVELTVIGVRDTDDRRVKEIILLASPDESVRRSLGQPRPTLTEMEAQVLEQLATGLSTQQLALRLYLSRQGVEYHIRALLRKLEVPNRTALVSRAYSFGIFSTGCWPPRVPPSFIRSSASSVTLAIE